MCQKPKLYILEEVLEDDVEVENGEVQNQEAVPEALNFIYVNANPGISLHAITCSINPHTMRVKGKMGSQWVIILIDTRSTHNFLDPAIVRRWQLPFNQANKVRVRVASGEQLLSEGECISTKFRIQGWPLQTTACSSVGWLRHGVGHTMVKKFGVHTLELQATNHAFHLPWSARADKGVGSFSINRGRVYS